MDGCLTSSRQNKDCRRCGSEGGHTSYCWIRGHKYANLSIAILSMFTLWMSVHSSISIILLAQAATPTQKES